MIDTCTITRAAAGAGDLDEETGEYDPDEPDAVYTGRCKVQQARVVAPGEPDAGERTWTVLSLEVHLPTSVTTVQVHDVVTITTSVHDPALVDRTFRVTDDPAKSLATARRLRCEEVL